MIFGIKILRLDFLFLLYQDKRKNTLHQQKSPFLYEMGLILFNNKSFLTNTSLPEYRKPFSYLHPKAIQ
jgi:hypothetical protein